MMMIVGIDSREERQHLVILGCYMYGQTLLGPYNHLINIPSRYIRPL